jgi:hypothetical protein
VGTHGKKTRQVQSNASVLSDSSLTHELSLDSLLPALLRLSDALPDVDGRAWPPETAPEPEPGFVDDALLDGRLAPERVIFDEGRTIIRSEDLFVPGRGGMNGKMGIDVVEFLTSSTINSQTLVSFEDEERSLRLTTRPVK